MEDRSRWIQKRLKLRRLSVLLVVALGAASEAVAGVVAASEVVHREEVDSEEAEEAASEADAEALGMEEAASKVVEAASAEVAEGDSKGAEEEIAVMAIVGVVEEEDLVDAEGMGAEEQADLGKSLADHC